MSVCTFPNLDWDCPVPGDGRKNKGHIWRICMKPGEGVRCAICGRKRRGK